MEEDRQFKSFALDLKEVAEEGIFEGRLSAYGNVDATGDVVERGAFSRTIKANKGRVPMLWQHNAKEPPVGVLHLSDGDAGLDVKGEINLEEPLGQRAYSALKFLKARGLKMGLSIGFLSISDEVKSGIRHLKEIKLFEGSLVTFPANSLCYVGDVKQIESKDFTTALASIQNWQIRHQLMEALGEALMEAFYVDGMSRDERTAACEKACDDFKAAFMASMPGMMDARNIKLVAPVTKEGHEILRGIAEWTKARTEPEVSTSAQAEPAGKGDGPATISDDPAPSHSLMNFKWSLK